MTETLTPHEALIYIMITTSAADGRITDLELKSIAELVDRMPVFSGFSSASVPGLATACVTLIGEDDGMGLDRMLEVVKASLTPLLYETAYALAVEVAAVDLVAEQEELRFLEMMRDTLEIDMLVAAAIERSARVRYRRI
jgi:tellurite resistance protein